MTNIKIEGRLVSVFQTPAAIIFILIGSIMLLGNEFSVINKNNISNYVTKQAVEISSNNISRENDNKLVITSGYLTTTETLSVDNISIPNSLALLKEYEMYQWVEQNHSNSKSPTYNKKWSNKPEHSANKQYKNPSFEKKSKHLYAKSGKFGAFDLCLKQTKELTNYIIYKTVYLNGSPNNPQIGDYRIQYKYIPTNIPITVIGKQTSQNNIVTYKTIKNEDIYIQYFGLIDKKTLLKKYINTKTAIVIRLIGFIIIMFALATIKNTLSLIDSEFIQIDNIFCNLFIRTNVFITGSCLTLVIISIPWILSNPIIKFIISKAMYMQPIRIFF